MKITVVLTSYSYGGYEMNHSYKEFNKIYLVNNNDNSNNKRKNVF